MKGSPKFWGLSPGERRAVLFICAAVLLGSGYRLIQRNALPDSVPLTREDSLAVEAIRRADCAGEAAVDAIVEEEPAEAKHWETVPSFPIDVNRADRSQLETLPGIGPVLAGRIAAERERRGGFRRAEELMDIPGIGSKRYEKIKGLITCTYPVENSQRKGSR